MAFSSAKHTSPEKSDTSDKSSQPKQPRIRPNKQFNCKKASGQISHSFSANFQLYFSFILLSSASKHSNIILILKPNNLPIFHRLIDQSLSSPRSLYLDYIGLYFKKYSLKSYCHFRTNPTSFQIISLDSGLSTPPYTNSTALLT